MQNVLLRDLPGGATRTYRFVVGFPDGGPGGADNAYQGGSVRMDYEWLTEAIAPAATPTPRPAPKPPVATPAPAPRGAAPAPRTQPPLGGARPAALAPRPAPARHAHRVRARARALQRELHRHVLGPREDGRPRRAAAAS